MERTLVAYCLMAFLILAGGFIGLHLRRNSRQRWLNRQRARQTARRQAKAAAARSA
jgi:hypothetical protein